MGVPRIVSPGFQVQGPGRILVTFPEVRKTGRGVGLDGKRGKLNLK